MAQERVIPKPDDGDKQSGAAKPGSWWAVSAVAALTFLAPRRRLAPVPVQAPEGPANAEGAGPRPPKDAPPGDQAAEGGDRGRQATTPADIPLKGWKDILLRVYEDFSDHRILAVAAGVTFYALLALFPAIAAFVSLYGLFAKADTINQQIGAMQGIVPSGALDVIGEQVKRIASKPNGTLGFALLFSLAVSLWSANAGMKAVFDALNIVYDEKEKRSFVMLNAMSLAFTVGAMVILLLALGAVVVLPAVLNFIGLGSGIGQTLLVIGRWPLMLVLVAVGLAVLYRYAPSRTKAQWKWITWGSGIAAVAWIGTSLLFSWYVSKFGNYNETYGSLGGAIGFMTWIWLSTTVILVGAEINAESEHQTANDTTPPAGKPLGTRGARMADTVGEAKA